MTERLADRFLPDPDERGSTEDADDPKLFGNDDAELPRMPGHPVSSAAGRSPEAREEQARSVGMSPPQVAEAGGGEIDATPFNLDKVDDLKRELRSDEGDRR